MQSNKGRVYLEKQLFVFQNHVWSIPPTDLLISEKTFTEAKAIQIKSEEKALDVRQEKETQHQPHARESRLVCERSYQTAGCDVVGVTFRAR